MAGALRAALVGDRPFLAVFSNAQEFFAIAQDLSGQVVEGIHFMRAFRDQAEVCGAELIFDCSHVDNAKLDFDFLRHEMSLVQGSPGHRWSRAWFFRPFRAWLNFGCFTTPYGVGCILSPL